MNKQLYGMDVDEDLSSSDDDSEDDNQLLEQRAEEIERELSNNLYLYDLHKELVNICEKTGDLPSLRQAFNRFAKTFPLTEELWLQWIKVEISIAEDEKDMIIDLFEKATKDYLSVKLWLEYIQYAISHCDLNKTHAILEKALSVAGLHFTDASLLWDTLRELEIAYLGARSKDTEEEYQAQLSKLIDAFKRQLSVPLVNITRTYDEWQVFHEKLPDFDASQIENIYKKSLESAELYKPYEDRLLMATEDQELVDVYTQYIKSVKNPSLVICLYERAVVKLCLLPQIWIDYIHYTLKLGDVCLGVSERALRNVTWSEELWCLHMKVLEKFERPAEEVTKCFEDALRQIPMGLDLWLDYIAFTRRTSPNKLTKLLEQAEEQQINDSTFKITRYHAQMSAKAGDLSKSRELWNSLMLDPTAKMSSQLWMEYARLERQYGSVATARGVFIRALTCNTDWPQGIADEWMMFERDEGSLEDVFKCEEKIQRILPLKLKAQTNAQQDIQGNSKQTVETVGERKGKRKSDSETNATLGKKQKTINKPIKNQGPPVDLEPEKSVFVSNLSPTVTQSQLADFFPTGKVTLATNNKGMSRCFAYVQFATNEEAQTALGKDRTFFESRPIFISKCKTDKTERQAVFKFSQGAEENKLFVKGLPVKYTKDEVENIFKPFNCKEVRLVLHKSGQSKGLAYVEFKNAADAARALEATNNTTVGNFVITVAISAPPAKDTKLKDKELPQRHSRSRLQVPLIPRAAMKNSAGIPNTDKGENGVGDKGGKVTKSNDDFRNMLFSNKE